MRKLGWTCHFCGGGGSEEGFVVGPKGYGDSERIFALEDVQE